MNKKERYALQFRRHIQALTELLLLCGLTLDWFDVIQVSKKLKRIDNKVCKLNESYSNGVLTMDQWCNKSEYYNKKVQELFNNKLEHFFINSDPRGYGLKLKDTAYPDINLFTDWGGYKLLAPELPC